MTAALKRIPSSLLHWTLSVSAHLLIFGGIAFSLQNETPRVAGSAGRTGSPGSTLGMSFSVETPIEAPAQVPAQTPAKPSRVSHAKKPTTSANKTPEIPTAQQGLALQTELPSEAINEAPRTIGEREEGNAGDGGSGETPAERIGEGDRSNRFGLHLRGIQLKIQSNLKPPGKITSSHRILLRIEVNSSGKIKALSLERPSGDARLDRLALDAAQLSDPFDPYDRDLVVIVPVHFRAR